jgi:hypothetical protein
MCQSVVDLNEMEINWMELIKVGNSHLVYRVHVSKWVELLMKYEIFDATNNCWISYNLE